MCFRFLVSFCLHSIQIDLYAEKRNNKFHLIIINWYFIMLLGAGFAQAAVVQWFLNIAFKYCNRIQWLPRAKQQWQENETHQVRSRERLWVRERKREKKSKEKLCFEMIESSNDEALNERKRDHEPKSLENEKMFLPYGHIQLAMVKLVNDSMPLSCDRLMEISNFDK